MLSVHHPTSDCDMEAKINEAQSRIATYEEGLELLEESSNDQITLSKLTQIKEQLELERKVSFQID